MQFLYYMITIMCVLKLQPATCNLQPATCKLDIFSKLVDYETGFSLGMNDCPNIRTDTLKSLCFSAGM